MFDFCPNKNRQFSYYTLLYFSFDRLHTVQAKKNAPPENKIRQKLRNLQVKPGKQEIGFNF